MHWATDISGGQIRTAAYVLSKYGVDLGGFAEAVSSLYNPMNGFNIYIYIERDTHTHTHW